MFYDVGHKFKINCKPVEINQNINGAIALITEELVLVFNSNL